MKFLFFTLTALTAMLTSCSWQNWYTGIRENQRIKCYELQASAEVQECLQRYNLDYQQYERARNERLEGNSR